jgi:hypothetical protein
MKHKHLKAVTILLIALILAGCTCGPTPQPATGVIPAGFDVLQTDKNTEVRFADEFAIPAGFFDNDSARFSGSVALEGVPLGTLNGKKTGVGDTIMERLSPAQFSDKYSQSSARVPIRLAALSLRSVQPIQVSAGSGMQQWDVALELSPSRASEGTMTINRRDANGGTFNSEFAVYPLYTFTRRSDGMQKKLDVGALNLPPKSVEKITLRTDGAPWSSTRTAVFQPGVEVSGALSRVFHKADCSSHGVIYVPRTEFETFSAR